MIKAGEFLYGKNIQGTAKIKLFNSLFPGILKLLKKQELYVGIIAFLIGKGVLPGNLMPFGFAFFAASVQSKFPLTLTGLCVTAGVLTCGLNTQTIINLIAIAAFFIINANSSRLKAMPIYALALAAAVHIIIPGFILAYLQGFLLYDVLQTFLGAFSVYILTILFRYSFVIFDIKTSEKVLTNEQVISVVILLTLAGLGLGDISIFEFSLKNVLSILLLLAVGRCYGPGAGSAAGVAAGLMISLSGTASPLIIGVYGFCGLVAGVFRILGKTGTILGFILGNTIMTLYLNGSTEVMIPLKDILAASVIIAAIPARFLNKVSDGAAGCINDGINDRRNYGKRIREITVNRLKRFSYTFKELATTFGEVSATSAQAVDKQELSSMFDRVADSVCRNCSLCLHCWDQNFYSTYQVLFSITEKLEMQGKLDVEDLPDYFIQRCTRVEEFVHSVNSMYEIFKINTMWKNKIGESRGLVSQQLDGLADVITSLANEINFDIRFHHETEELVLTQLQQAGLKIDDISVYENKYGKYEVSIVHKGCKGRRVCVSNIEKQISNIMGRKMTREIKECTYDYRNGCALKLVEEERYRVTTGIARVARHDSSISGDSYGFMNTGDGKYIVILSDGMGSGPKAAAQSKAAVNLFEQFVESGFEKDTAIRLINSVLMLKSTDENYTTVDIALIDMYNGQSEFVKIGAMPTIIKKENGLETVKAITLPIGILSNVEAEMQSKQLKSGDLIVMMTDGVIESSPDEDKDLWIYEALTRIDSTNPQEIADKLLEEAYTNYEGKPMDDMIVCVAKIWEKFT